MTLLGKLSAVFALLFGITTAAEAQTPQSPIKRPVIDLDTISGNLPAPDSGTPDAKDEEKKPLGSTISDVRPSSRLIEGFTLERRPVYPADPEGAWWEANPRTAFALAQRQQRPLLLLFTADWNAKCEALSREVFTTKTFNDYAKENVIVCYLLYARSRTDDPDTMRHWKEKFKVLGYPNLLIFDPQGNVVQDVTGYHTGRPVTYFNELKNAVQPVINQIAERKHDLQTKGFRDWRNTGGNLLFARFVKWGGELVTLQSADQRLWTIDLSTLSENDRKFVRSFPTVGEVAVGNAEP